MTDQTVGAQPSESVTQAPAKKAAPLRKKEAPTPEPLARAGGHVDRGDGLGWVPEE